MIRSSVGNEENETATVSSIAARPRGRPTVDRLTSRPRQTHVIPHGARPNENAARPGACPDRLGRLMAVLRDNKMKQINHGHDPIDSSWVEASRERSSLSDARVVTDQFFRSLQRDKESAFSPMRKLHLSADGALWPIESAVFAHQCQLGKATLLALAGPWHVVSLTLRSGCEIARVNESNR